MEPKHNPGPCAATHTLPNAVGITQGRTPDNCSLPGEHPAAEAITVDSLRGSICPAPPKRPRQGLCTMHGRSRMSGVQVITGNHSEKISLALVKSEGNSFAACRHLMGAETHPSAGLPLACCQTLHKMAFLELLDLLPNSKLRIPHTLSFSSYWRQVCSDSALTIPHYRLSSKIKPRAAVYNENHFLVGSDMAVSAAVRRTLWPFSLTW